MPAGCYLLGCWDAVCIPQQNLYFSIRISSSSKSISLLVHHIAFSMSLGWQSESALLPSKSKPINNVNNASIVNLKAVLYEHEQKKLSNNKSQNAKVNKNNRQSQKLSKNSNIVIEEGKSEQSSLIYASLSAKAELYDDILKGKMNGAPSLIDFKTSTSIFDINVNNDSHNYNSNDDNKATNVTNTNLYPWSNGKRTNEDSIDHNVKYLQERKEIKTFQKIVENKVKEATSIITDPNNDLTKNKSNFKNSDNNINSLNENSTIQINPQPIIISEGAKIKTKWDMTLKSSARSYLDEVHNQIESERQLDDHSNQLSTKKRSAKEERMEMIRLKQMKYNQTTT
eukprot:gene17631-24513_t